MKDSEYIQRARAAALRFLSYRPRSEAEVRARLSRQYPSHIVEQVIQRLVDQTLLDDANFAELWTTSRESLRPRSASAIRHELLSKGVSRELVEVAVSDVDDIVSAYHAGQKFSRRLRQSEFPDYRKKLWGHLQRRGFSATVIHRTVAQLWTEEHQPRTESSISSEAC